MKALVRELNNRGYVAESKDVVKNSVTFHGIMIGEGNINPYSIRNQKQQRMKSSASSNASRERRLI